MTAALAGARAAAVVVTLPQPRTADADNGSSVNLAGETPGQGLPFEGTRQRDAQARWSLSQLLATPAPDTDPRWSDDALCAQTDPEAFFPEKGGSTREAKKVCAGCAVRDECLEYALAHDERFGIWGGLSERERRTLRRERRR